MADASPATEVHDTPEPVLTSATAEDQAPPQVTEAALSGSPDKQKCSVGDQNACTTPDAASGTPAAEVASEPPQLPGSSPPAPQAASASKRKVFSGLMARLAKPKTRRGPNDSEPGGALKPNRISGSGSASMQVTPAGAAAAAVAAAWTQAEPLGHLKQEKVIEPFKLAGGGTIVTENDLKTEVSDDTKAGSAYLDPLVGEKGDSHVKTKSHPQGPETLDLPAESKDLELEAKEEETDKYECAGDEEDTESRPADNLPAVSLPERQTQRRRVPSAIAKAAAETEAEFFASRGRGKGRGSRGSRHSGVASARRGGRGRARGRGAGSESGKTTPATPSPRVVSELARPDLSASIEHDVSCFCLLCQPFAKQLLSHPVQAYLLREYPVFFLCSLYFPCLVFNCRALVNMMTPSLAVSRILQQNNAKSGALRNMNGSSRQWKSLGENGSQLQSMYTQGHLSRSEVMRKSIITRCALRPGKDNLFDVDQ